MEILILILAVLVLLVLVGTKLANRKSANVTPAEPVTIPDAECCGAHEVCEADSLMNYNDKAEYFDDEELDKFAGKTPSEYSRSDTSQFQQILYTLRENEVAGWLRSLQIRNIELPLDVREEALMIVSERRFGNQ
jgi:hypothetical protein